MDYDVVIIGGGPAGSSAAYFLRDSNYKVLLIERLHDASFTRYHEICGAGVSRNAVELLSIRKDEILNKINNLRLAWPGGNVLNMKIDGYIIDRPKMLNRIRLESVDSGIEFISGSVTSVSQDQDKCIVSLHSGRSIECRYVIGADGAYSVVRKSIFNVKPDVMLKCIEYHSAHKTDPNTLGFVLSEKYFHFYEWSFPYGDGRCTGSVYGYADVEPDSTKGVRTIPSCKVKPLIKGRVMLIGDAAGLPNPMTAGGLRTSIYSAKFAVESLVRGDLALYEKLWDRSHLSDHHFYELQEKFSKCSDSDFAEFSKYMVHKGIWLNGLHSFIHHPTWVIDYITCLKCLKYGW